MSTTFNNGVYIFDNFNFPRNLQIEENVTLENNSKFIKVFDERCTKKFGTVFKLQSDSMRTFSLDKTNTNTLPYISKSHVYHLVVLIHASNSCYDDEGRLAVNYDKNSCNDHEYVFEKVFHTCILVPANSYATFTTIISDGCMRFFTATFLEKDTRLTFFKEIVENKKCMCYKCNYWYELNSTTVDENLNLYFYDDIRNIILSYHAISDIRECICDNFCCYNEEEDNDEEDNDLSYCEKYWIKDLN